MKFLNIIFILFLLFITHESFAQFKNPGFEESSCTDPNNQSIDCIEDWFSMEAATIDDLRFNSSQGEVNTGLFSMRLIAGTGSFSTGAATENPFIMMSEETLPIINLFALQNSFSAANPLKPSIIVYGTNSTSTQFTDLVELGRVRIEAVDEWQEYYIPVSNEVHNFDLLVFRTKVYEVNNSQDLEVFIDDLSICSTLVDNPPKINRCDKSFDEINSKKQELSKSLIRKECPNDCFCYEYELPACLQGTEEDGNIVIDVFLNGSEIGIYDYGDDICFALEEYGCHTIELIYYYLAGPLDGTVLVETEEICIIDCCEADINSICKSKGNKVQINYSDNSSSSEDYITNWTLESSGEILSESNFPPLVNYDLGTFGFYFNGDYFFVLKYVEVCIEITNEEGCQSKYCVPLLLEGCETGEGDPDTDGDGNGEGFGRLQNPLVIYPKASSNIINILSDLKIEQLNNLKVIDKWGNVFDVALDNAQINVSNLRSGVYYLVEVYKNQIINSTEFIKI